MPKKTLAQLRRSNLLLYRPSNDLYEIYNEFIRLPLAENALLLEECQAIHRPTLILKKDKEFLIANNFVLYNLVKKPDLNQDILKHDIFLSYINDEDFVFGVCFYEIINLVIKHKKSLNIQEIYNVLNNLMTHDICKRLFNKNIFAITTFCDLINITEQTYYNRIARIQ